jgi:hypothetical protein
MKFELVFNLKYGQANRPDDSTERVGESRQRTPMTGQTKALRRFRAMCRKSEQGDPVTEIRGEQGER